MLADGRRSRTNWPRPRKFDSLTRNFGEEAVRRRVTAGDGERAGRLVLDIDDEMTRSGGEPGWLVMRTFLKKPRLFRRRSARSISTRL